MTDENHDAIYARIDRLAERVNRLENKLAELEASGVSSDGTLDRYDASVLDAIEPGDTLTLEGLQNHYRRAGIVQANTIKQRIKRLTSLEYFKREGRTWTFQGVKE